MRKIIVKITVRADRFPSLFLSLSSPSLYSVLSPSPRRARATRERCCLAAQRQSHSRALLPRCALAAPPRHTAINDLAAPSPPGHATACCCLATPRSALPRAHATRSLFPPPHELATAHTDRHAPSFPWNCDARTRRDRPPTRRARPYLAPHPYSVPRPPNCSPALASLSSPFPVHRKPKRAPGTECRRQP